MKKTMAWLMNTFRVGKKIWKINDAEVSRTLAGFAYVLLMGYKPEEGTILSIILNSRSKDGITLV